MSKITVNENKNEMVRVNKSKMQKWLREHVEKNEKTGLQGVADKLGCTPTEDNVRKYMGFVYAQEDDVDSMMNAILRNEDRICKTLDKKLKSDEHKSKADQKAEGVSLAEGEIRTEEEILLEQLSSLRYESTHSKVEAARCESDLTKLAEKAKANRNKALELQKQVDSLFESTKLLEKQAVALKKEQQEWEEKAYLAEEKIPEITAKLQELSALHFTSDPECVSDKCVLMEKCPAEETMKKFFELSTSAEGYSSEFQILREAATLEDLKKIAEMLTFAESKGEQKLYWHFKKSDNVTELLTSLGVDVVID